MIRDRLRRARDLVRERMPGRRLRAALGFWASRLSDQQEDRNRAVRSQAVSLEQLTGLYGAELLRQRGLHRRSRVVRRRVSLETLRDMSPQAIEREYGIPADEVPALFETWA